MRTAARGGRSQAEQIAIVKTNSWQSVPRLTQWSPSAHRNCPAWALRNGSLQLHPTPWRVREQGSKTVEPRGIPPRPHGDATRFLLVVMVSSMEQFVLFLPARDHIGDKVQDFVTC